MNSRNDVNRFAPPEEEVQMLGWPKELWLLLAAGAAGAATISQMAATNTWQHFMLIVVFMLLGRSLLILPSYTGIPGVWSLWLVPIAITGYAPVPASAALAVVAMVLDVVYCASKPCPSTI